MFYSSIQSIIYFIVQNVSAYSINPGLIQVSIKPLETKSGNTDGRICTLIIGTKPRWSGLLDGVDRPETGRY